MKKDVIAISLPTGIGADIGGYAGDFGYVARKFSKYFHLIINPNAVNGGILSAINYDMSYLEGYLFDDFFKKNISITPKRPYEENKIGVIFDCSMPENIRNIHINTINALKYVKGIDIIEPEYTKKSPEAKLEVKHGISAGTIKNPDVLLESSEKLIKKGAEAIAVVCYFSEDYDDINYENAQGIDPIGGIEAIISHLIAKEFKIPCAHSPAFCDVDIAQKIVNPKVSSELISSTYLPCIIEGLSIAPKIFNNLEEGRISYKDVKCLIVPKDAMGSSSVLSCNKNNIKIITVENKTTLNVTKEKLNIKPYMEFDNYNDCLEYLTQTNDL